jgi:EAL domain-containing protein (putative c-di-GMP-specific phosphodiesterase class I)
MGSTQGGDPSRDEVEVTNLMVAISEPKLRLRSRAAHFVEGGLDGLTTIPAIVSATLIGLTLFASWALSYASGGEGGVPPHLFYVPIVLAGLRFGYLGAFMTSIAAGVLAGPLLPHDVAEGTAQTAGTWIVRAAFYVAIGQFVTFVLHLSTESLHREVGLLRRERRIRQAIDRDEFVLHYQPVVRLTDHQVVGVESLVRWDHPERGLLFPSEFIDDAETTGVIVPLGRWVLDRAARQHATWRALDPPTPFTIAINLSPRHLEDPEMIRHVEEALDAHNVRPNDFCIELTEGTLLHDVETSARRLRALRDLGVLIAIDDFGSGFSSLGYLRELPVDIIKLGPGFIAQAGDTTGYTLLRNILNLANELGTTVIAEGIEHSEQAATLMELGCSYAQGWLFGAARPGHVRPPWVDFAFPPPHQPARPPRVTNEFV